MKKWLNPASLAWLFLHVIALLLGVICWMAAEKYTGHRGVLEAVGSSLIATGAAGEILFLYVMITDSTKEQITSIINAGIYRVFPARSIQIKSEYDKRLTGAKNIDIIGYGLSSLREDYVHDFATWSRKAVVRILILDPDFPNKANSYARQREREERNHVGKIRKDVRALIESVNSTANLDAKRFQIRLLRTLPSVNIFRINDEIFWGPYFALQQSRSTPTLLVKGGFLFDRLQEHFDTLWNSDEFSSPAFPP